MTIRWQRLASAATVATLTGIIVPAPALAAYNCQTVPAAGQVSADVPVEDQLYTPKRLAQFATGAGIRVAVIDSGVSPAPQLRGRVERGEDLLHHNADARQDCVGHGTAVASIIAAAPAAGTGFQGLAPDAVIVPIRVSERVGTDGQAPNPQDPVVQPAQFAAAITWAVDRAHVQVINLSLTTDPDNALRAAIEHAIRAGVVVVAAVGNSGDAQQGNPTPYPASYDGVIGVGAITPAGVRAPFSQHGTYVDIVAQGAPVTGAAPGSGTASVQGTSFAAPFVSATAALIKQRFPNATPAEVAHRLFATADPAPGGPHSDDFGYGLLNPYRALTETLGPDIKPAAAHPLAHTSNPRAEALAARRAHTQHLAMLFGMVGAAALLLLGAVATVVRRAQRRGWRPGVPAEF